MVLFQNAVPRGLDEGVVMSNSPVLKRLMAFAGNLGDPSGQTQG
jgi:hypothetical protein